jgi:hypothetical protein
MSTEEKTQNPKSYYICIYADGIEHKQLVYDKMDMAILQSILDKVKRNAEALANQNEIKN